VRKNSFQESVFLETNKTLVNIGILDEEEFVIN
jgi:hypothetical protein